MDLFKMDAWGNIEWQTAYGGANDEFVRSMIMTSDGHLMLAAYSDSDVSGNKTVENVGGYDIWLLKLDSMGNKIWDSRAGSKDGISPIRTAWLKDPMATISLQVGLKEAWKVINNSCIRY